MDMDSDSTVAYYIFIVKFILELTQKKKFQFKFFSKPRTPKCAF